jgi:disulfide bond formation protein DsbB
MQTQTAELFFSLLTLIALGGAVVITAARLLRRSRGARELVAAVSPLVLVLGAVVAITATAGSLYFSEVANLLPCKLCWFQRIAMYPLSIILLIAAIRRDRDVRWYVVPIAAVGAVISLYHWLLERFPDLDAGICTVDVPCEFVWFERFGFITLPFMALTGFLTILALVTLPITEKEA